MFTYLLLNLFTISFPLARSFESKIKFVDKWKYLFVSIFFSAIFFIIWDHLFTISGIWQFNENYILGIYVMSLPIEEWLFFITVPFACVFIYEVVKYFFPGDPLKNYSGAITLLLTVILVIIAVLNIDRLYTFTTFSLTAGFLIIHWLMFKNRFLGYFYLTYLFHLVPFFIINGILTSLPVVIYNDMENLGFRLFTVPVEDTVYSLLLLLMTISIYQYLILKNNLSFNHGIRKK